MRKKQKIRVERRTLADGTIKEYKYEIKPKSAKAPKNTISALIADWQHSTEWRAMRPKTVENYTTYIKPLYEALRHASAASIKRAHLLAIRDRVASERGTGAAIAYCVAVSSLFAWALDRQKIEFSPATKLIGKLRNNPLPTWTEEQAAIALAGLPEPLRRLTVLGMHTGQRRGDLVAITWSAYKAGRITFAQQKSGKKVVVSIPVSNELAAELAAWKRDARAVTILETKDGKPMVGAHITLSLPRALAKLGLPKGLNVHGLRKLAAVRLAQAGCTAHEIAAITGHQTLQMVQHYTKAADQRVLSDAAVRKLYPVQTVPKD